MRPLRILTVCTGNICRSPLAEMALRRHLNAVGIFVQVRSAGTNRATGSDNNWLSAAKSLGYDLSRHYSRRLYPETLRDDGRDLILAMDRTHLERIVATDNDVWRRTFTLAELVRRANGQPGDTLVESFPEWIDLMNVDRTTADVFNAAGDDIPDPYGAGSKQAQRTAEQIEDLANELAFQIGNQIDWPARIGRR